WVEHCLTADEQKRTLRVFVVWRGGWEGGGGGRGGEGGGGGGGGDFVCAGKEARDVKLQIAFDDFIRERFTAAFRAVPLFHQRGVVQQINRQFDEYGTGRAVARLKKGFAQGRRNVAHAAHGTLPFDGGFHQRELVNVLERAASLQRGRRRAADEHDGGLRQLRVLDGGQRIRNAGTGSDDRDAGNAGETRDGIGGKDRVRFVTHVNDANAALFCRDQNRRDVSAGERKHKAHAFCLQNFRNVFTAVHTTAFIINRLRSDCKVGVGDAMTKRIVVKFCAGI